MTEIILRYFPDFPASCINQFSELKSIYQTWNSKINLISRKDFENFNTHHVLHSLAIAKIITFADGTKILDVGTGGGFPGIPLAIMFPRLGIFSSRFNREKNKGGFFRCKRIGSDKCNSNKEKSRGRKWEV